jgi:hypothetical protein
MPPSGQEIRWPWNTRSPCRRSGRNQPPRATPVARSNTPRLPRSRRTACRAADNSSAAPPSSRRSSKRQSAAPVAGVEGDQVEIQPIRVELEREEDGRILAWVPDLPGLMAYSSSEEVSVRKVKSIALQVLRSSLPRERLARHEGNECVRPCRVLAGLSRACTGPARLYRARRRCAGEFPRSRLGPIESCSVWAGPTSHPAFTTARRSAQPRCPRSERRPGLALKISDRRRWISHLGRSANTSAFSWIHRG